MRIWQVSGKNFVQQAASKQKCAGWFVLRTDGMFKKTPQSTTWIPPNGTSLFLSNFASCSRLFSTLGCNWDTSSITRTSHWRKRRKTIPLSLRLLMKLNALSALTSNIPTFTPAHQWIEVSLTRAAASHAGAQNEIFLPGTCVLMCSRRWDFPAPASPVRKRFILCSTTSKTSRWNLSSSPGFAAGLFAAGVVSPALPD